MDPARVATALRMLADAFEADPPVSPRAKRLDQDGDWFDQHTSPLGKRKHMALCRAGAFPGARKDGKSWFVRRAEVDAYITEHGQAPGSAANDVEHLVERFSDVVGR